MPVHLEMHWKEIWPGSLHKILPHVMDCSKTELLAEVSEKRCHQTRITDQLLQQGSVGPPLGCCVFVHFFSVISLKAFRDLIISHLTDR